MYIKVEDNGSIRQWSVNELRQQVDPDKLGSKVFRQHYNDEVLADLNVFNAIEPDKPDHDPATQKVVFGGATLDEGTGKYTVTWKVLPLPQEEIDAYWLSVRTALDCTARQARLALKHHGMLQSVNDWVANSGDEAMQIEWEYGTTVKRLAPFVIAYAQAHNITDEAMDKLFWDARTV